MTDLIEKATTLKLFGLCVHWHELSSEELAFVEKLLQWEEIENKARGLQRRLSNAKIGRFKPLADFDWNWPEECDKSMVSDWLQLSFIQEATNIILVGNNGLGKSTIAKNIAHTAVLKGHSVLFVSASKMLGDLVSQDGALALQRRLKHYSNPEVLVIDEIGYLSYSNRHADLLFEIVNRRYENKPTIITTNKAFTEWGEVFPNASCAVSLIDRLVHHADIMVIKGGSYRMKEAQERVKKKSKSKKNKGDKNETNTQD